MATSQINARIDSTIKLAGDAALAEAGYTPTRAIRVLWEFASHNRGNASELRKELNKLEGKLDKQSLDSEAKRRLQIANDGPAIADRALAEMGIDSAAYTDGTPIPERCAIRFVMRQAI